MNGNYGWGLPIAASTYAGKIDFGIYVIHAAMIAIFVLWGIFFTYLLIRYRRREGVKAEVGHVKSTLLKDLWPDLAVMFFEIALIVFYAIPVWSRIKSDMPMPEAANEVGVIAEQFGWNVHYPGPDGKFGARKPELVHFSNPLGLDYDDPAAADDIIGGNEIHMPLGRPTLIHLSSKDVIHSFFVPEFRMKQDAVPGLAQRMWVEPTREGVYEMACAQLCGLGHALMRGDVIVQSEKDFDAWLASKSPQPKEKPVEAW